MRQGIQRIYREERLAAAFAPGADALGRLREAGEDGLGGHLEGIEDTEADAAGFSVVPSCSADAAPVDFAVDDEQAGRRWAGAQGERVLANCGDDAHSGIVDEITSRPKEILSAADEDAFRRADETRIGPIDLFGKDDLTFEGHLHCLFEATFSPHGVVGRDRWVLCKRIEASEVRFAEERFHAGFMDGWVKWECARCDSAGLARAGAVGYFPGMKFPLLLLVACVVSGSLPTTAVAAPVREEVEICIYGGTSAGAVAAVHAARMGRSVVLVEAGQHIGGMSVEGLGGTDIDNHKGFQNSPAVGGLALEFYRRVGARYGREARFDEMLRKRAKQPALWRFESHVAEEVFDAWLREAGVRVLRGARLAEKGGARKEGARLAAIRCENGTEVVAKVFIDATYEGDLLAAAGISTAIGREGNARYGETKNGIRTDTTHGQFDRRVDPYVIPGDPQSGVIFGVQDAPLGRQGEGDESIQGYCFRLCLTKDAANRLPIEKPANYDPARYELQRRYLAAGGVISAPHAALPNGKTDPGSWHHLAGNFTGWNHKYPSASYAEREAMLRMSREHIQGFYWFMANDPAVPEQLRAQWAAWGLCRDEFQDNGGWPRAFYVRNGRRMVNDFVLTEAHVHKAQPEPVADSVGMIWWPPDLHHARRLVKNGAVWNEGAVFDARGEPDWIPCGIPYRALVPRASECTNVLTPTCPSSSYVAYGAYRIEFTFMAAGQATATAAALAVETSLPVQEVDYALLRERLLRDGQVLTVPEPGVP